MFSARLGAGSLTASLTGLLALTGDMTNIAAALGTSHAGLLSALEPVFSAASLTGFVLGILSSRANKSRHDNRRASCTDLDHRSRRHYRSSDRDRYGQP